jgi:hypothetical protein
MAVRSAIFSTLAKIGFQLVAKYRTLRTWLRDGGFLTEKRLCLNLNLGLIYHSMASYQFSTQFWLTLLKLYNFPLSIYSTIKKLTCFGSLQSQQIIKQVTVHIIIPVDKILFLFFLFFRERQHITSWLLPFFKHLPTLEYSGHFPKEYIIFFRTVPLIVTWKENSIKKQRLKCQNTAYFNLFEKL